MNWGHTVECSPSIVYRPETLLRVVWSLIRKTRPVLVDTRALRLGACKLNPYPWHFKVSKVGPICNALGAKVNVIYMLGVKGLSLVCHASVKIFYGPVVLAPTFFTGI